MFLAEDYWFLHPRKKKGGGRAMPAGSPRKAEKRKEERAVAVI